MRRLTWHGAGHPASRSRRHFDGRCDPFFIKYEDIEIVRVGDAIGGRCATGNRLAGRLRDIIFKGQTANYIVSMTDGSEIVASASPRDSDDRSGEDVSILLAGSGRHVLSGSMGASADCAAPLALSLLAGPGVLFIC